ncbi:hypothetical protein [Actinomadura napierensis]|uniref:hypothetical protein n=1 Tax=Actinomadura napierensis TaxID=267854 RepID=UPI0031DDBED6
MTSSESPGLIRARGVITFGEGVPYPQPRCALVYVDRNGTPKVRDKRPGMLELLRYTTWFEVDVADHLDVITTNAIEVEVRWRVTDPARIVMGNITDGQTVVRSHVNSKIKKITQQHDIDKSSTVEDLLQTEFAHPVVLDEGITILRVVEVQRLDAPPRTAGDDDRLSLFEVLRPGEVENEETRRQAFEKMVSEGLIPEAGLASFRELSRLVEQVSEPADDAPDTAQDVHGVADWVSPPWRDPGARPSPAPDVSSEAGPNDADEAALDAFLADADAELLDYVRDRVDSAQVIARLLDEEDTGAD